MIQLTHHIHFVYQIQEQVRQLSDGGMDDRILMNATNGTDDRRMLRGRFLNATANATDDFRRLDSHRFLNMTNATMP